MEYNFDVITDLVDQKAPVLLCMRLMKPKSQMRELTSVQQETLLVCCFATVCILFAVFVLFVIYNEKYIYSSVLIHVQVPVLCCFNFVLQLTFIMI